ncbi:ABC transporter ATP-binding protein [Corynebacterium uberis]|uniref:ABC transporter ATP-binding protein n=1 Tax=Corynebacterium uberis TaxID=2883169 RepID=UPI001D0BB38D|nr:ABC transporter ATP-binding protein [Corynebacterium uberis]UDL74433.1 ABC transporter ATP-binding protein [Corynebacterium uberis]UDL83360.1 ABC transporter ATP-binding protein [Corynebacterium uberis]
MSTQGAAAAASVTVSGLRAGYGSRIILDGVDLQVPGAQVTTIIGPNGCGKSTLLSAMNRTLPSTGAIRVGDTDVTAISRRALARMVGSLPQSPVCPEGIVVADLVERGRHPHQSWIRQWSRDHAAEVSRALEMTGITGLAQRRVDELSGGQRQRVWISMVLAQDTPVLLLDEPTTFLDLSQAISVLRLVRRLEEQQGRTVVMVLHDLNLAIRYSHNLVIMKDGRIVTTGRPEDVITQEMLADVFDLDAVIASDPVSAGPLVVPR